MDSRLQRVGGTRLVNLRRSDAPRVAQAIVDFIGGRAKIFRGQSKDTVFVKFVREDEYTVVVREDDWRKIFPFFRYSTSSYSPVIPPPNEPPPIMSPQPNRLMPQPPENPAGGIQSFLGYFSFDEYSKIQQLLTTLKFRDFGGLSPSFKALNPVPDGTPLEPPEQRVNSSDDPKADLYNQLVKVLQQLFPVDFPTTY